jgi:hypothetical protein
MSFQPTIKLASSVLLVFGFIAVLVAKQNTQPESNFKYLTKQLENFLNYAADFNSFAGSHTTDALEFEVPDHLSALANLNAERLRATLMVVGFYENTACEKDRLLAKSVLKNQLDYHLKQLKGDIEAVNSQVAYTKLPAISQTAIHMKDNLRDLSAKLDSIQASLE